MCGHYVSLHSAGVHEGEMRLRKLLGSPAHKVLTILCLRNQCTLLQKILEFPENSRKVFCPSDGFRSSSLS